MNRTQSCSSRGEGSCDADKYLASNGGMAGGGGAGGARLEEVFTSLVKGAGKDPGR